MRCRGLIVAAMLFAGFTGSRAQVKPGAQNALPQTRVPSASKTASRFREADFAKQNRPWQARWIAAPWSTVRDGAEADGSRPLPIFRREFVLRNTPVHATLRIAGLGQWSASLAHAGELRLIEPKGLHGTWTDYRKRVEYESVEVTASLRRGPNVLAVMLGNGMYNVQHSPLAHGARYTKFEGSFGVPKLIAELAVHYADGTTQTLSSDAQWKVARGPVVFDSTYGGEDYDARREQSGWDRPSFEEKSLGAEGWAAAQAIDGPGGVLVPAIAPAVGQHELYLPVKQTDTGGGRIVYDLGQNFAGIVHLRAQGPAGAVLRLTPGELLKPDGTVSQATSGGPMWWSYTLRGDRVGEDWEPLFGYYGFRYVQAEWMPASDTATAPAAGKLLSLSGIAEHMDAAKVGSFESSSELLNSIHQLIVHAMLNNEASVLTDCPHREKLGWLEQDHLQASGLMFNNDLEAMYRATSRNMEDAQAASGMVPTIAPQYTKFGPQYAIYDDSPEWGSAAVLAPWAAFRFYGDKQELQRSYPMMQAWVRYLQGRAENGIVSYGLGDWYDIGPGSSGFGKNTTQGVTGTLMLVECAQAMQRIAQLLGKPQDAATYAKLEREAASAFQTKFWDPAHGWYDKGSQTANAMPLALGIVPQTERAAVLAHVVADIEAHADHVTTGEVGFPYLLRALLQAGRNDVVMRLMLRRDPPSYAAQIAAGATSLTEAWEAGRRGSQDHFMLGGGEEWFYRAPGGINLDLSRPLAAERVTLRPAVLDGLDWVRCGFQSKLGKIQSNWKREGAVTTFDVSVPVEATVVLPLRTEAASVRLAGGIDIAHAPGVHPVTHNAAQTVLRVAPGTYHFVITERPR